MPGVGVFKGGPGWGTPTSVLKEGMDQGLLAVTGGSAAKGSAMGLEVAGSGLVQLPFFPSPLLPYHVWSNIVSFNKRVAFQNVLGRESRLC